MDVWREKDKVKGMNAKRRLKMTFQIVWLEKAELFERMLKVHLLLHRYKSHCLPTDHHLWHGGKLFE